MYRFTHFTSFLSVFSLRALSLLVFFQLDIPNPVSLNIPLLHTSTSYSVSFFYCNCSIYAEFLPMFLCCTALTHLSPNFSRVLSQDSSCKVFRNTETVVTPLEFGRSVCHVTAPPPVLLLPSLFLIFSSKLFISPSCLRLHYRSRLLVNSHFSSSPCSQLFNTRLHKSVVFYYSFCSSFRCVSFSCTFPELCSSKSLCQIMSRVEFPPRFL